MGSQLFLSFVLRKTIKLNHEDLYYYYEFKKRKGKTIIRRGMDG